MVKMWKALFEILRMSYITFCILVVFHTFFTLISLKVKLKVKMNNNSYIWFSMGIDHSNPYIHSTTVLCDLVTVPF